MAINSLHSYTAASTMPIKLLKNDRFMESISEGIVLPIHIQVSLTNKCNLKCGFCSCKNVDRTVEIDFARLERMIARFAHLGTQAVTITGGGDPLCYSKANEVIKLFKLYGISVGLVTNGTMLHKLSKGVLDAITWCRISCSDERTFDYEMNNIICLASNTDFAFSYVVTKDYNADNLIEHVAYANMRNFSHVRVVSNLIDLDSIVSMDEVKESLASIDDSRVIYQGRKEYTPGMKNCWISLLKPIIDSEGNIYPCCGVQYAHEEETLEFPKSMRMGSIEGISHIYKDQRLFDGSKCHRCYYENYNMMLDALLSRVEHIDFV